RRVGRETAVGTADPRAARKETTTREDELVQAAGRREVSAVPGRVRAAADPAAAEAPRKRVPLAGTVYGVLVAVVAATAALPLALRLDGTTEGCLDFALISAGAAIAQLFVVHQGPRTHQSYHAHAVFLIPAIL